MPTYEFRCPEGHDFEKFYRSIGGAEAQAICPVCGQPAERVMSATGFAFKGSGFYLTDYGKNAHREKGTPEPKSGAPAGEGGSSEGAKSEPKGGDAAPSAAPSASGGDKKGESRTAEQKSAGSKPAGSKPAESKPSVAAPKKSSGE